MQTNTHQPAVNPFLDFLFRANPALAVPSTGFEEAGRLFEQFVDQRVSQALTSRAAENERAQLVDSKEAGATICATPQYVLKLHRNGQIPARRTPGTRHIYFKIGDLQDWLANNTRAEDGGRKYTKRNSAPGAKKKGD